MAWLALISKERGGMITKLLIGVAGIAVVATVVAAAKIRTSVGSIVQALVH